MLSQSELAQRIHAGVEKVDPNALLAIGLFSDPYPPIEAEHRLTRRVIEVLTELERRFVIVTKGTLVTRDVDLLVDNRYLHEVVISLFSHDDDHLRAHEPGAASFGARRTFGDHMSQLDIDRAYLREVMRLYDQAIWAFPITAREHCVARMSRFDVLRLVSELDAYAG